MILKTESVSFAEKEYRYIGCDCSSNIDYKADYEQMLTANEELKKRLIELENNLESEALRRAKQKENMIRTEAERRAESYLADKIKPQVEFEVRQKIKEELEKEIEEKVKNKLTKRIETLFSYE